MEHPAPGQQKSAKKDALKNAEVTEKHAEQGIKNYFLGRIM